jgi:hypothetical protein
MRVVNNPALVLASRQLSKEAIEKHEARRFYFRLILVGVTLFVLMATANRMIEIQMERQQYAQMEAGK